LTARQKLILVVPPMLKPKQIIDRWEKMSKALDANFELATNAMIISWDGDSVKILTTGKLNRQADAYLIALAWP
jgi:hypothetical protein